ncbi:MAG: tetratricopeptide repeat protein [Deltaproteobacteria bacterium]|nr:tetratricopeptide repeat protein [Deltaproteobacteria bacterium]
MSTLSVCMIAKNEEAWIGECLLHLQSIADEIIVVDTGSTDRTIEIANASGAKVFSFKWMNDFSKARNFSLEQATKDWILVIDPDERISERDLKNFKRLTKDPQAAAYAFNCRNYVRSTKTIGFQNCKGEYPQEERDYPGYVEHSRVQLFKNLPHVKFTGIVHESILDSVKHNLIASDIPIHHYGYLPEVAAVKNKRELYSKLGEEKLKMNSNDWYAHFELGVEYLTGGRTEQAIKLFERANELQPKEVRVLNHMAAAYLKLENLDQAEKFVMECLSIDANHTESATRLGVIWMKRGQNENAMKLFDKLIEDFPPHYLTLKNAALCAAILKRSEKSLSYFENAFTNFSSAFDCWVDFTFQLLHGQNWQRALEVIQAGLARSPEDSSLLRLGFETALRVEHYALAENFIRRFLNKSPEDAYAKAHLTTALLFQKKFDDALEAANDVLKKDPGNFTANLNCGILFFEGQAWGPARRHLETALKSQPQDEFIKQALVQISKQLVN